MSGDQTTSPPSGSILLWDVGGCWHGGQPAHEVCIVIKDKETADLWWEWLRAVAPDKDRDEQ